MARLRRYTDACDHIDGVDDTEEFRLMHQCMLSLRFEAPEMEAIFKVVAACLHLGNMCAEPPC